MRTVHYIIHNQADLGQDVPAEVNEQHPTFKILQGLTNNFSKETPYHIPEYGITILTMPTE